MIKTIVINKQSRKIANKDVIKIGIDGENLQEKLIFKFDDEFVDGQARIEIEFEDETKNYITLSKNGESYELPIKSVITKKGLHYMQLVIDESAEQESIPIFKSEKFYVKVSESINAVEEAPEGYTQWIEIANAKINEMNLMMQDLQTKVDSGYFNGKDALINGFNTLEIVAGQNIIIEQVGNQLIISAIGVTPLPDNHLETSDGNVFKTIDDAYFIVKESE